MESLANSLNDILPYAFDENAFNKAQNHKIIEDKLSALKKSADSIPDHVGKQISGDDPLFQMGLTGLRENIGKAQESFQLKNFTYSQSLIQGSVNYCFKCHIGSNFGPKFSKWENFQLPANSQVHPMTKAKLYIATRQFAKADEELLTYINKHVEQDEIIKRETALKMLLATSLRFDKSPQKALNYLKQLDLSAFSVVFQKNIKLWEKQLTSYVAKPNMNKLEFKKVFADNTPAMDGKFIKNVLLTSEYHGKLSTAARGAEKATIYNQLGDIYDDLGEISFWELPEHYYEACINEAPKTKIAKECYKNLSEEITLGFSGSSGIHIPPEEIKRLETLKKIAE